MKTDARVYRRGRRGRGVCRCGAGHHGHDQRFIVDDLVSRCSRCSAPLKFVKMRTGKAMPVDPIPDDLGNVLARPDTVGRLVDGHVKPTDPPCEVPAGYRRYMPHWSTCAHPSSDATHVTAKSDPEPEPALF